LAGLAPGQDRAGLAALAGAVRAFLGGAPAPAGFAAFDGVAAYTGRHVCVLLPFEAALKALEGTGPSAERAQGQPGS
jgi:hypothetical protein